MSGAGFKFAVAFRDNDEMLQAAVENLRASAEYNQQVKEYTELLDKHLAAYTFATPTEQSQYGQEVELSKEIMERNKGDGEQLVKSVAAVEKRLKASKTVKVGSIPRTKADQEIMEARTHLTELKEGWTSAETRYKIFKAICKRTEEVATAAALVSSAAAATVTRIPTGVQDSSVPSLGIPGSLVPMPGGALPLPSVSRGDGLGKSGKGYALYFKQGVQRYKDTNEPIDDWLEYIQERGHDAELTDKEMYRAITDHLEGEAAAWLVQRKLGTDRRVDELIRVLKDAFGSTESSRVAAEGQLGELHLIGSSANEVNLHCIKFERLYQRAFPGDGADSLHKKGAFEHTMPEHIQKQMRISPYSTYT
jgi:hypothetical protein